QSGEGAKKKYANACRNQEENDARAPVGAAQLLATVLVQFVQIGGRSGIKMRRHCFMLTSGIRKAKPTPDSLMVGRSERLMSAAERIALHPYHAYKTHFEPRMFPFCPSMC